MVEGRGERVEEGGARVEWRGKRREGRWARGGGALGGEGVARHGPRGVQARSHVLNCDINREL